MAKESFPGGVMTEAVDMDGGWPMPGSNGVKEGDKRGSLILRHPFKRKRTTPTTPLQ
jgi:hypothetical protein